MVCLVKFVAFVFGFYANASTAAFIQHRQYWPDPGAGPNTPQQCTETSLTSPTWGIYSPSLVAINSSSGGTQGDIRFLTVNAASGLTAECAATDIDIYPKGAALNIWHNCSIPELFVQFDLESFEMRLRGSWQCDNSSSIVFTANGTWETPLIQGCFDEDTPRGRETLCIMGNSQVPSSLSSPVAIHPQLPLFPYTPRERAKRCVDRSYDPEWQINNLLYEYHMVETDNKTSVYYDLLLSVINLSNGENTECSITVDLLQPSILNGSAPWVGCQGTNVTNSSSTPATFDVMIDRDYGIFGIRDTWECSDGVPDVEGNEFSGIGYTSIDLDCGNPRNLAVYDSQGLAVEASSDYNCSLATSPATFTGYRAEVPPIPHTYYTRSCTINSIYNTTTMALREYQIETTPQDDNNNEASITGTFGLYNPGSGDTYKLYRIPVIDDGDWHECTAGLRALPWQLVTCQYMLDRRSNRLAFQVQWYCDDRDARSAILFDATVEEQLPVEACELVDGRETCGLPVDVAEVAMAVSSLSWTTSGKAMDMGPTMPWI
ncbi:uncharacterized protein B0H64DRAFT_326620 [Chaetomium fimeti]|uniref:Uncharacterized protein n=1 Tax=Chaetomium fimeti TaxID=1854472 RepID=A0AAE0LQP4_9PEZI|nr:hypothetical protein B0H64DRAFT_326620 [Chaetomium fimeti]